MPATLRLTDWPSGILPSFTDRVLMSTWSQMMVPDWLLILPTVMPWVASEPEVKALIVVAFTVPSVGVYSNLELPPTQVKVWPLRLRVSPAPRAWLSYSSSAVA